MRRIETDATDEALARSARQLLGALEHAAANPSANAAGRALLVRRVAQTSGHAREQRARREAPFRILSRIAAVAVVFAMFGGVAGHLPSPWLATPLVRRPPGAPG